MLITVRLHLCKTKFFWLHTIEVIWFFKDLHTSVLLLQQHHSVKKYLLQIPDSKSSHMQPILARTFLFQISCSTNLVPNLLNLWQIWQHLLQCKLFFFWLNYGASKQLWCIQTSSVTYEYISRKKEIKMVRQNMTEKEGFTYSTFWLCETQ